MAVAQVLARLRREPLGDDLPIAGHVGQLCRACGHAWRGRLLTPLVTLRLFLTQVLHGNTSVAHLRQLAGLPFAPGSYCEARERLPLAVIVGLVDALRSWAERHVRRDPARLGPRVLVVDGSSFSTADTPELRKHFGIYPGAKPGVAYPMGKLLGLLDAASGMFVELLATPPLLSHEAGQVTRVHPVLRAGDILLGDRAFCSFVHVALLDACGVLACFHLHQRRKAGRGERRQRWLKPAKAPAWMCPGQFALLPAWVDVRLVSYAVGRPGFRTTRVTVRDHAVGRAGVARRRRGGAVRPAVGGRDLLRPPEDDDGHEHAQVQDGGRRDEGTGHVPAGVQPGPPGDAPGRGAAGRGREPRELRRRLPLAGLPHAGARWGGGPDRQPRPPRPLPAPCDPGPDEGVRPAGQTARGGAIARKNSVNCLSEWHSPLRS